MPLSIRGMCVMKLLKRVYICIHIIFYENTFPYPLLVAPIKPSSQSKPIKVSTLGVPSPLVIVTHTSIVVPHFGIIYGAINLDTGRASPSTESTSACSSQLITATSQHLQSISTKI